MTAFKSIAQGLFAILILFGCSLGALADVATATDDNDVILAGHGADDIEIANEGARERSEPNSIIKNCKLLSSASHSIYRECIYTVIRVK